MNSVFSLVQTFPLDFVQCLLFHWCLIVVIEEKTGLPLPLAAKAVLKINMLVFLQR